MDRAALKEELQKSATLAAARALAVKPQAEPSSKGDQDTQLASRGAMVAAYAEEAKKTQATMVEAGTWEGGRDLDWHDAFMADKDSHGLSWEDFSVKSMPEKKA